MSSLGVSASDAGKDPLNWFTTRLEQDPDLPNAHTLSYAEFSQWIARYIHEWPAKDRKTLAPVIRELTFVGSKVAPDVAVGLFLASLLDCIRARGLASDAVWTEPTAQLANRVLDNQNVLTRLVMAGSTDSQSAPQTDAKEGHRVKPPSLAACTRPYQLILIASLAAAIRQGRQASIEEDKSYESKGEHTLELEEKQDRTTDEGVDRKTDNQDAASIFHFTTCDDLPYGLNQRLVSRKLSWSNTKTRSRLLADLIQQLAKLLRPHDSTFRSYIETWYFGGGREAEDVNARNQRLRTKIMERATRRAKRRELGLSPEDSEDGGLSSDDDIGDDDDSIRFLLPGADDLPDELEVGRSSDSDGLFKELDSHDAENDESEADIVTRHEVAKAVHAYRVNSTAVLALLRAILRVCAEHSTTYFTQLAKVIQDQNTHLLALAALVPHASLLLRPWLPPSHAQNWRFVAWTDRMASSLARDCLVLLASTLELLPFDQTAYSSALSGRTDVSEDAAGIAYTYAATLLACTYVHQLIPQLRLALRSSAKPPKPLVHAGPSSRSQSALLAFLEQDLSERRESGGLSSAMASLGSDPFWKRLQVPKWVADWLVHFVFDSSTPLDMSFSDELASRWSYGRFIMSDKGQSYFLGQLVTEATSFVESSGNLSREQFVRIAELVKTTRANLLEHNLSDLMAMSLTLADDSVARPNKTLGVRMCAKVLYHTAPHKLIETGWGFVALESLQRIARYKEEPELVDITVDTAARLFAALAPSKPNLAENAIRQKLHHDKLVLERAQEEQRQLVGYLRAYESFYEMMSSEPTLRENACVENTEALARDSTLFTIAEQKLLDIRTALSTKLADSIFALNLDDNAAIAAMRASVGLPPEITQELDNESELSLSSKRPQNSNVALNFTNPTVKCWLEGYISELQHLAMSPPDDNAGSDLGEAASAALLLNAIAERRWLRPRRAADETTGDGESSSSYQTPFLGGIPPLLTSLQLARTYTRVSNTLMLALGPEGISEVASQLLPPLFTLASHHDIVVRGPALHAIGLAFAIAGSRLRVHARQFLTWLVDTYITLNDTEFVETVSVLRYGLRGWIHTRSPMFSNGNTSDPDSDDYEGLPAESSTHLSKPSSAVMGKSGLVTMQDVSAVAAVIAETALAASGDNSDDEESPAIRRERELREQYERWKAYNSKGEAVEGDDFEEFKAVYGKTSEDARLEELLERYRVRKARLTSMTTTERFALGQAMESELALSRDFVRFLIVQLFTRIGADVDLMDALREGTQVHPTAAVQDSEEPRGPWLPGLEALGEAVMTSLEEFYLGTGEI